MTEMQIEPASIFSALYEQDHWGYGSGPGSRPYFTIEYRAFLEKFIGMNGINTIVDIGCGDWQFSRHLNLDGVRYYAFDVVQKLIDKNSEHFGTPNLTFERLPLDLSQLPNADMLIMKDVLQHWPDEAIQLYTARVFPRFKYCLITNSFQKVETPHNINIPFGNFRTLDLTTAPHYVDGCYIFEYWASEPWERIRTLLVRGSREGEPLLLPKAPGLAAERAA